MTVLKTHTRKYGDLKVEVRREDNGRPEGPISDVTLTSPTDVTGPDVLSMNAEQAWNLVDLLGVVDPNTFAQRHPNEQAELALRRVADYFKERARVNREAARSRRNVDFSIMADTFDLAVTRVMEEIEGLYPHRCNPDEDHDHDPIQALNNYHARS